MTKYISRSLPRATFYILALYFHAPQNNLGRRFGYIICFLCFSSDLQLSKVPPHAQVCSLLIRELKKKINLLLWHQIFVLAII